MLAQANFLLLNKNKMKKIIALLLLVFFAQPCLANNISSGYGQALKSVHIKYERVAWREYDFSVKTNLTESENVKLYYEWVVDGVENFNVEKLRYFFERGNHTIKVRVEDEYGNTKYDTVHLNIDFWSLQNNWFWWALYLVLIVIILYYWTIKVIYLLNKKRFSRHARYFLDIMDEHGWVERVIAHHVRQHEKELQKLKQKNKKNKS